MNITAFIIATILATIAHTALWAFRKEDMHSLYCTVMPAVLMPLGVIGVVSFGLICGWLWR